MHNLHKLSLQSLFIGIDRFDFILIIVFRGDDISSFTYFGFRYWSGIFSLQDVNLFKKGGEFLRPYNIWSSILYNCNILLRAICGTSTAK